MFKIDKIIEKLKLSFSFLNRSNSSEVKQKIQASQTGHVVAGDLNIHDNSKKNPSNLEKQLMKLIYREYKDGRFPRVELSKAHNELNIKSGQYVGVINNSDYITLDTNSYILTDDGIRYMDNRTDSELNQIVLSDEQKRWDDIMEIQRINIEKTKQRNMTNWSK